MKNTNIDILTKAYHEACDKRDYKLCDILREEIRKELLKNPLKVASDFDIN